MILSCSPKIRKAYSAGVALWPIPDLETGDTCMIALGDLLVLPYGLPVLVLMELLSWELCGFKGCKAALLCGVNMWELSLNPGRTPWEYSHWKVTRKSELWLVTSKACVMSVRWLPGLGRKDCVWEVHSWEGREALPLLRIAFSSC